jgi:hypothetical protein
MVGQKRRRSLLIALALSAFVVAPCRARSQSESSVQLPPFTAEFVEKYFDELGQLAPEGIEYGTIARKPDGSEAFFSTAYAPDGSGASALHGSFSDVPGRRTVSMEPFTKSTQTYYYTPQLLVGFESCPSEDETQTAERSRLLGYEVVHLVQKQSSSREVDTYDRWVAHALGCLVLSETSASSWGSRNEKEVISIIEGEPLASWFTIPSGYTERSPSQMAAAYVARFPGHRFVSPRQAVQMDRAYYAHRSPGR